MDSTMGFRVLLMKLDSELGSEDCHKLKFLAADIGIPKSKLESMQHAIGIFDELERQSLVTPQDVSLLRELMELVHRRDLLKEIDTSFGSAQNDLRPQNRKRVHISEYRSLLLEIADNTSSKEFEDFKRACKDTLPRQALDKQANIYQMFTLLEERELLSPSKLDFLGNLLHLVGNVQMVQRLQQHLRRGCPNDVELMGLVGKLGNEWRRLGSYLGLEYNTLEVIDIDHRHTDTKIRKMLMTWRQGLPLTADGYALLAQALKQCGRNDLAQRVTDMRNTEQRQASSQPIQSGYVLQQTDQQPQYRPVQATGPQYPPLQGTGPQPHLMKPSDFQKSSAVSFPPSTHYGVEEIGSQDHRGIPNNVLQKLSEKIPSDWRKMASHLGIAYAKVQIIDMDFRLSYDKALDMLMTWRNGLPASADAAAELTSVLKEVGRVDLAEALTTDIKNVQAQKELSLIEPSPEPMDTETNTKMAVQAVQEQDHQQGDAGDGPVQVELSQAEYKMDRNPRGMCLIINNAKFDPGNKKHLSDRPGSEIDSGKLDNLFNKLHFNVKSEDNLTTKSMQKLLNDVSQLDHSEYDCFVCCIMSHGSMGLVYGTDGEHMEIRDVLHPFKPLSCDTLKGKPKLFFIQACQGTSSQETVLLETDDSSASTGIGAGMTKCLPNEADFLLSYATVPGYVSYRNKKDGTWFVKALVNQMTQFHDRYPLLNILTMVNEEVSSEAKITEKFGIVAQIPAPSYTLRKAVFLRSLNA